MFPPWLGSAKRICGGAVRASLVGNRDFKSHPFELQIGLLDFKKGGKAFTDVAPAGRLDLEVCPLSGPLFRCSRVPPGAVGPAGPRCQIDR